ncbi:hypothetical protein L6R52_29910 [Myxococcota bacterium]|nr:hypothetical protein [Myxococcota bacterium]
MGQARSLITGFAVALVIGAGGGFALKPLAASGKSENASAPPPVQVEASRLVVEDVAGSVRVLVRGESWRRVRVGDVVERPTVLVTEGPESSVTVVTKTGLRVVARHDARVLLSASGGPLSVQLDSGLALVFSRGTPTSVHVPSAQAVLTGEVMGVWAKDESFVTAVLEGELKLDSTGAATKYAKGREIRVTPRGPIPLVLPSQLEIMLEKTERVGARYKVSGKTSPNAQLFVRRGSRFEPVELTTNGNFTVDLDTKEPQLGDIVAYDAAGRRAEVNVPSETLEDVLNALARGEVIERRTAGSLPMQTTPEPAKAADAAKTAEPAAKVAEPAAKAAEQSAPETVEIPNPSAARPSREKREPEKRPKADHAPRGSEPSPVTIDLPGLPKTTKGAKKEKTEPAPEPTKPVEATEDKAVEVQFE